MAKITKISKGNGNINSRISEVECAYNVGVVNGEKYVALCTYGSKSRKDTGTASQVLHIDEAMARRLVDVLRMEFDF